MWIIVSAAADLLYRIPMGSFNYVLDESLQLLNFLLQQNKVTTFIRNPNEFLQQILNQGSYYDPGKLFA